MSSNPFGNLPSLSHEDALEILMKPFHKVNKSSDYYKAVFNLIKYPGADTEKALILFLESNKVELELKIAQRKAAEVLGILNCTNAIPALGRCLKSKDPYLVENAVWSLQKLRCQDISLHFSMMQLLEESEQNRRVIIQALSSLGVLKVIPKVKSLLKDKKLSNGLRGALIAAEYRLTGQSNYISELDNFLQSPNQNERHCAVQDVVHSKNIDLMPSVLKAPVSPSFKIKLVESFWNYGILDSQNINLFSLIDSILLDDPDNIKLIYKYERKTSIEFLIDELFSTDFDRCYLAMKSLKDYSPDQIIYNLEKKWDRARKDYGALYFYAILYRYLLSKYNIEVNLESKINYLLSNNWPDFMKFRPIAISSLIYLNIENLKERFFVLLNEENTPFWLNRYSALVGIQKYSNDNQLLEMVKSSINDSHELVRKKAKDIYRTISK